MGLKKIVILFIFTSFSVYRIGTYNTGNKRLVKFIIIPCISILNMNVHYKSRILYRKY